MMLNQRHIWKILIFDMFIIEFGPVGVFFAVYYFSDFMVAALGLATATLLAMILSKVVNQRLPLFAIFSGIATILTAVVTYLFTAPWVLIIADSFYYFLFAGILAASTWGGKLIFKSFFEHVFALQEAGWRVLQVRWTLFFVLAGVLNESVRLTLSVGDWVLFKQGLIVVFVVFGLYQFRVSTKYRSADADRWGLKR